MLAQDNYAIGRSRNLTFNDYNIIFWADRNNLRVDISDFFVPHLTRHFLAFENLSWISTLSYGSRGSVNLFMTVGVGQSGKIPSFHNAGKTLAF